MISMTDYSSIIQNAKPELDKIVTFFEKEVSKIRTGRASPSLVEDVKVNYLGQELPLKQLASITVGDPRQIVIQPWDASSTEAVTQAILKANLGVNPIADNQVIRISLPSLTQEYREELVTLLNRKKEESRVTIRKWRDEVWGDIQEKVRSGELREDDKFRGKDQLQKIVDEYYAKLDAICARKEQEIRE